MNKLITTESGGHPLTLDDFGFIQGAYREAFAGLLMGLSESTNRGYKLIGCETYYNSGTNTLWISEGYMVIKLGALTELYHVKHHDLGVANFTGDPYWAYVEEAVAPSPVTYKNLNIKNVHKKGTLTLSPTFQTMLFPRYSETPNWERALKNWFWKPKVQFQHMNGWIPGVNPVPNGSYSVEGKRVFLCGDIRYSGTTVPSPNLPFTVLPPELRPADSHMFMCLVTAGWNGGSNTLALMHGGALKQTWVRIQTDGNCFADPVNVAYNTQSPNFSIVLDGVSWLLP